jgi:hypothetical protein
MFMLATLVLIHARTPEPDAAMLRTAISAISD